jgi:nitrous oxidase accessory protein
MPISEYTIGHKGLGFSKRYVFFCLALVALFCLMLLGPAQADAKTVVVGVDYPTIGAALKKVSNGDVIEVKGGEYREEFRIEKAVHLKGTNSPVVIGKKGHTIEIASRGVTVEGFVLRDENPVADINSAGIYISKGADGAIVKDNRFYGVMHAVWSVEARGVRIENNIIEGRKNLERNYRGNGIYLTGSPEATITGNTMDYCRDGIYIEVSHEGKFIGNTTTNSRYGIHTMWVDNTVFSRNTAIRNLVGIAIMYSKNSVITDNVAAGNQTHGLLLNQTTRSRITGNTVIGNTKGVYFYNSVFNSLSSNLIMNNSLGLHSWGGSMDNTVNGNTFISNEVQVKFVAGKDQQWDGNYWSDYLGWDMNGDGIGDMPYETNSVVDHILWRYPTAKLLYASASLQLLWMIEKQFPILKVPKVADTKPSMRPLQTNWRALKVKYPYTAERYYGEIEKLPITH